MGYKNELNEFHFLSISNENPISQEETALGNHVTVQVSKLYSFITNLKNTNFLSNHVKADLFFVLPVWYIAPDDYFDI